MAGAGQPRICVIGAGPSGLTTLKNLRQAGLANVVCHEASGTIGGNWAYTEAAGHSSVYACTFLISSKKLSQFEDYPMPDCYPDFCSHAQVLAYFESYARHFEVLPFIRFRTKVCHAAREPDGSWRLRIAGPDGESEQRYDVLLVCTGHHSDPVVPRYPGEFLGTMLHSHSFKTATPFRGQRVLVVGAGNSACDVAVDISRVAARTALSMRHGQHIIPKIVFGMPVDVVYRRLRHLPKPIRRFVLEQGLRLVIGRLGTLWPAASLAPADGDASDAQQRRADADPAWPRDPAPRHRSVRRHGRGVRGRQAGRVRHGDLGHRLSHRASRSSIRASSTGGRRAGCRSTSR